MKLKFTIQLKKNNEQIDMGGFFFFSILRNCILLVGLQLFGVCSI